MWIWLHLIDRLLTNNPEGEPGQNSGPELHTFPGLCPESEIVETTQMQEALLIWDIQSQRGQGHTVPSLTVILAVYILRLLPSRLTINSWIQEFLLLASTIFKLMSLTSLSSILIVRFLKAGTTWTVSISTLLEYFDFLFYYGLGAWKHCLINFNHDIFWWATPLWLS